MEAEWGRNKVKIVVTIVNGPIYPNRYLQEIGPKRYLQKIGPNRYLQKIGPNRYLQEIVQTLETSD